MCYQYSRNERAKLRKHIKKVRRERNLSIKETAAIIGTVKDVIPRWEANRTVPENSKVGGILRLLGYNPLEDNVE